MPVMSPQQGEDMERAGHGIAPNWGWPMSTGAEEAAEVEPHGGDLG
jgi:hypothetical protein